MAAEEHYTVSTFPQHVLGERHMPLPSHPFVSQLGELSEDQGGKELAPGREAVLRQSCARR